MSYFKNEKGELVPSSLWGAFIGTVGCLATLLWLVQQIGWLVPEGGTRLGHWAMLVVALGLTGVGGMLIAGEGHTVGEAFLSWFGKRTGGGD